MKSVSLLLSKIICLFLIYVFSLRFATSLYVKFDNLESNGDIAYQNLYNVLESDQDPVIKNYFNDAKALHQISANTLGALIDPQFFLGAAHVVYQLNQYAPLQLSYNGNFKLASLSHKLSFKHPIYDLTLLYLNEIAEDLYGSGLYYPVKRYNGSSYLGEDYYLYADMWHQYGLVDGHLRIVDSHRTEPGEGLYAKCKYPFSEIHAIANMPFMTISPRLKIETHGGDSSCGIYKKVGTEFQLFGINAPAINSTQALITSYPDIQQWINKTMLSVTLGQIPDFYLNERPDYMISYLNLTDPAPFTPKDIDIIEYKRRLASIKDFECNDGIVAIDSNWVVALPEAKLESIGRAAKQIISFRDGELNPEIHFNLISLDKPVTTKIYQRSRVPIDKAGSYLVKSSKDLVIILADQDMQHSKDKIDAFAKYETIQDIGMVIDPKTPVQINLLEIPNGLSALTLSQTPQFKNVLTENDKLHYNLIVLSHKNNIYLPSDIHFIGLVRKLNKFNASVINISNLSTGAVIDKNILQESLSP